MMRPTLRIIPLFALALCACNPDKQGSDASKQPGDTTREAVVAEPDPAFEGAPAGTQTIASLLKARHAEDLPDADTLAAQAEAEAALRWLATNGDGLATRTRALASLRFYASQETRELLMGVLGEASTHPALRAAAIEGTGGLAFEEDGQLRALIEAEQASEDPRVQKAASARLSGADELAAP